METYSFCTVPTAGTIYAGPRTKEEFDLIPLPVCVHGWCPDQTTTLIENDGQLWESCCHSKFMDGSQNGTGFNVIFQWFDRRQVSAAPAEGLETPA